MARNSGTNLANGILSGIVLACGIIFSVLIALLFQKVVSLFTTDDSLAAYASYASSPIWSLGFAYMVPGLIGVIASLIRHKGGFITQMVFSILTLVIMGIFFVVGIIALSSMSLFESSGCYSVGNTCTCLNGFSSSISLGNTCEDLNSLSGMSIGAVAMMVLGWIFTLCATITGGILACSREEIHPGVIVQPSPPAVTVMHVGHVGGVSAQGGYAAQPGYGIQPVYGVQPGYAGQPGYSAQHAGSTAPPYTPVDSKDYM